MGFSSYFENWWVLEKKSSRRPFLELRRFFKSQPFFKCDQFLLNIDQTFFYWRSRNPFQLIFPPWPKSDPTFLFITFVFSKGLAYYFKAGCSLTAVRVALNTAAAAVFNANSTAANTHTHINLELTFQKHFPALRNNGKKGSFITYIWKENVCMCIYILLARKWKLIRS